MKDYKVIYIDYNFIDSRYPNSPADGDSFYTYGWGSLSAREFKKQNSDFHVECWKTDPRINRVFEKEIEGVYYRMFPSWNLGKMGQFSIKLKKHLKKWLKTKRNTVFNIASFNHMLFYSVAIQLKNQPLVVQNHGEGTANFKASLHKGIKHLYYFLLKPLEKYCFRYIDLLYVLDERIINWLPKNQKRPIIKVSTTGVNGRIFKPLPKEEAKKQLGLDPLKKYLLYVGRLNYTKRADILLDVYNELKLERRDIGLILAGHEKIDPLYQKAIDSGAHLYGVIPQSELYIFLNAGDIYLLPGYSKQHTFGGIGMLTVQALLCNTPVVGGTLQNFPEIDREFVGIPASNYSSIKKAIISIIDEKIIYEGLRQYALKYYSWEKISRDTTLDYKHLLQRSANHTVVYIDRNFIDSRYPNKPSDGDSFFTHGFGSLYAKQFKKYNPEITVECWKADPRINEVIEKEIQGVYYRMFPSWNIGKIGQYSPAMKRFLKSWVKLNTKSIFNISSFDHLLFYTLALRMKNHPLVVQNHGEATAIYKTTIKKGLKKAYFFILAYHEKLCFRNINMLYVLDDRIIKWLPVNKQQPEIKVSTTGVDEKIFIPLDKTEAKKALGLDPKKKYLMYVGRLNLTKRPDMLIDVYNELKKERNDVELILAGNESTDPLYQKAKESGAILYGVIKQTDLYKYLSAASAYVLAKLDTSIPFGGIGMLSVQALLCETPIVGATVEAFPKRDREKIGIATFEYPQLKEALLRIIDDEIGFITFRKYALKYYSWKAISQTTAMDYKSLIQND